MRVMFLPLMLHDLGFEPPVPEGRDTHDVAVFVATELLTGRSLFAILGDRFVTDRMSDNPFLLDELAREPLLRGVVEPAPAVGLRLAA
jgi:hypothetical protein